MSTNKMAGYQQRVQSFVELLEADKINLKDLRSLCFSSGCPHEKSIRSRCWKILLNYLPLRKEDWKSELQKSRSLYDKYVEEMILIPGKKMKSKETASGDLEDHPLNPNPDSEWRACFNENEMLVQIDKDCRRLCPDLSFFQQATDYPCEELVDGIANVETLRKRVEHTVLHSEIVSKNRLGISVNTTKKKRSYSDEYSVLADGKEAHWEVVERILFIYAVLNPGIAYVQGMNEILGPIYYTFANDPDPDIKQHAEADSFYCFTSLMAEIRDIFLKTLDDSQCGIGSRMNLFMDKIKHHDRPLWQRLQDQEIKPQFFAFRWLSLLLSQEFQLPDVLRIWDSLFSDPNRFDFLIFICCAMLISIRNEVLRNDFPSNMKLFQKMGSTVDLQQVLAKARELSCL